MQQLRQGKGLDQAAVAREVGISPVYLKQIESGEREPGEPVIRNIARALQVEMSQLMDNGD
nr:helix-turn-helix transcriptional regulator [Pseudomaricurvus alkylphenolicus]